MFETLQSLLARLTSQAYSPWAIFFELMLIGVAVNWCASVLQGTRGTRLLRGLAIVLIVATLIMRIVSAQNDWSRLELLYRYFLIGLAFIALVAFQPELRRALIRAGEVSFLRRGNAESKVIAALVESAKYLSRNKFGALVALQRDVGLRNWAENGTAINAELSANLLNSIFFPNSPLHDLGVIVDGNRVLAANCQFPQAESGEMETSLGSRHRAAVGLSQESDALVLVVSEETGAISLADGGKLIRFLTLDDLEQELTTRLRGIRTSSRLRRSFSSNAPLRAARRLAVVVPLTLVIWFLAEQASLIVGENIDLRLVLSHPPTLQVDIQSPQPPLFSVSLRGPAREIDALKAFTRAQPLNVDWSLPLAFGQPGQYTTPIAPVLDELPAIRARGLSVVRVNPGELKLATDDIVIEPMPVRVDAGAVVIGEDLRVEPPVIQVAMRRRDLEKLDGDQRAVYARLRIPDAAPSDQPLTDDGVILDARIGESTAITLVPDRVRVTYRVVGQRERKTLSGVVVRVASSVELQQRLVVIVDDANEWRVDIEVEGEKAVIERLQPESIFAVVRLSTVAGPLTPGPNTADVELFLPEGVRLLGRPPRMRFEIEARDEAQR